jgi:hypothetical protein
MSFDSAFRPTGLTKLVIASSSTAGTATQWSTGGMPSCYVANGSTSTLYLAWGTSNVQAAQPTTGTPALGLALLSTASRCFQLGPNPDVQGWISAVTSGGSGANLFITPGIGF